jgi:hypothetical protein
MNIIGPDALVFGVDDVAACTQYLTDYGLQPVGGGRFEALDGTAIVIAARDDKSLPPGPGHRHHAAQDDLRRGDQATVDAIATGTAQGPRGSTHCPTARSRAWTTWASRSASR